MSQLFKKDTIYQPEKTLMTIRQDMEICQSDYPLDWYQKEFIPYAEEYQALPDRKLTTVVAWMKPYMKKAQAHFGDALYCLHIIIWGEILFVWLNNLAGKLETPTNWP